MTLRPTSVFGIQPADGAAPTPEAAQLPVGLRELLAEIHDAPFRDALEKVFRVAAAAIGNLRNFDLIRYESSSSDGEADLALFEEIAPVLMSTVNEANRLVEAVERAFPDGWRCASTEALEAERAARAVEILRERTRAFRTEVLQFGARLRTPQAVADRWNLLANFQGARGKLRAEIGTMVTDVANVFAEIPGSKVVPEHDLDIEHALLLRRTLAKLTNGLRAHNERLRGATPEEVPKLFAKLAEVIARLPKTQTWFELRAPDKREFIRFREQIDRLRAGGNPVAETRRAVEGFVSFLELLTPIISQREILRVHDRACLAEVSAHLEQAESQIEVSEESARFPVIEALELCEQLEGRDAELDRYVAALRKTEELPARDAIPALREHALRLIVGAG